MATLIQKMPQYRHLAIKGKRAFKLWLKQTATTIITFLDKGQRVRTIWTDRSGEILYANQQDALWCGFYINPENLAAGRSIEIWDNLFQKWMIMYRHVVEKVALPQQVIPSVIINKNIEGLRELKPGKATL
ncbi:MAG: hypothetical protein ABI921_10800 [Panacibacter sp.]